MSDARGFWVRWRVSAGYPVAGASVYFARPSWDSLAVAALVGMAGLIVRGLAAGVVRKREELATSGVYAWTRNPLYFGSTILAAAFAVGARSWIAAALIAGYLALFYPTVIRREEQYLHERFGARFEEYVARVPAFVLWPRKPMEKGSEFSWAQYWRNHEYRAAFGVLLAFGLLLGRMWLRSRWG